jgi:hypothetical protein
VCKTRDSPLFLLYETMKALIILIYCIITSIATAQLPLSPTLIKMKGQFDANSQLALCIELAEDSLTNIEEWDKLNQKKSIGVFRKSDKLQTYVYKLEISINGKEVKTDLKTLRQLVNLDLNTIQITKKDSDIRMSINGSDGESGYVSHFLFNTAKSTLISLSVSNGKSFKTRYLIQK